MRRTAIGTGIAIVAGWPFASALAHGAAHGSHIASAHDGRNSGASANFAGGGQFAVHGRHLEPAPSSRVREMSEPLLGALHFELAGELHNPHRVHAALECGHERCRSLHRDHGRCSVRQLREPSQRREGRYHLDIEQLHRRCGFRADGLRDRGLQLMDDLGLSDEPHGRISVHEHCDAAARRRARPEPMLRGEYLAPLRE